MDTGKAGTESKVHWSAGKLQTNIHSMCEKLIPKTSVELSGAVLQIMTPLVCTLSRIAQENCVYCVISSILLGKQSFCVPFLLRSLEAAEERYLGLTTSGRYSGAKQMHSWCNLERSAVVKLSASLLGAAHPLFCALVFMFEMWDDDAGLWITLEEEGSVWALLRWWDIVAVVSPSLALMYKIGSFVAVVGWYKSYEVIWVCKNVQGHLFKCSLSQSIC